MIKISTREKTGRIRVQTTFHTLDKNGDQHPISEEHRSKTRQEFSAETDASKIMANYINKGISYRDLPMPASGVYGDFTEILDYQTAVERITAADDAFMALDADIRSRFGNDPAKLIKFLSDKTNDEEAYKLGLKVKPETVVPEIPMSDHIAEGMKKFEASKKKPVKDSND